MVTEVVLRAPVDPAPGPTGRAAGVCCSFERRELGAAEEAAGTHLYGPFPLPGYTRDKMN